MQSKLALLRRIIKQFFHIIDQRDFFLFFFPINLVQSSFTALEDQFENDAIFDYDYLEDLPIFPISRQQRFLRKRSSNFAIRKSIQNDNFLEEIKITAGRRGESGLGEGKSWREGRKTILIGSQRRGCDSRVAERKVRGRSLLRTTTFLSNRAISFFPNENRKS